MTDKTLENMANSFLELWQRQLETVIKDPEMVGNMLKMMQQMQQGYSASQNFINEALAKTAEDGNNAFSFMGAGNQSTGKQGNNENYNTSGGTSGRTSGGSARTSVYGHGDDESDDLHGRIAFLEKKIAKLEDRIRELQPRKTSRAGKPRSKSRRKKAK